MATSLGVVMVRLLAGVLGVLGGCTVNDEFDADKGEPDPYEDTAGLVDSGDSGGDSGEAELTGMQGTVEGTLTLQLYTEDVNGDMVLLDWVETYGGYPFGKVFVEAFGEREEGGLLHYGSTTVTPDPSTGACDDYSVQVSDEDAENFRVYAVVDEYGWDGIIGTSEPTGVHSEVLVVKDGETVSGIDITIYMPWWDIKAGGGGCDVVTLSGDLSITLPTAGEQTRALLYDANGDGPYFSSSYTATASDDGVTIPYSLYSCANYGEMRVLGAWDSNQNDLIDPEDRWGSYLSAPDTSGNPVTIGTSDLTGLDITIPWGDAPEVVPFVVLSGELTMVDGFDSLGSGAGVYVAAMKSRPSGSVDVASFEDAYDYQSFSGADLTGSAIPFTVISPANTSTYVWAYVDLDGDGIVNEPGEPVTANGTSGKTDTSASQSDLTLAFATPA